MPFADIIGHERPVRILRAGLAAQRLPHALLFEGPDGVGKKLVALEMAKALNCEARGDDACGDCRSCSKIARDVHPDVKLVRRAADKSSLLVEQVRELIRGLQYRPYEGRAKVVIIDGAEDLSAGGENALLKTLEEPTDDSFLVLITSEPNRLLPTTRSRCQRIAFGTLPRDEVAAAARKKADGDETAAAVLAALAGGSLGHLRRLDAGTVIERWEAALAASAGRLGSLSEVLELAEAESGSRERAGRFLALVEVALRDLMLRAAGGPEAMLVCPAPGDEDPAPLSPGQLVDRLELVDRARRELLRNANPRLVLESSLLRLRG